MLMTGDSLAVWLSCRKVTDLMANIDYKAEPFMSLNYNYGFL